jgi:hypothetical protein
METPVIIALVTVAAAVLQIILFFKLWGMANNVCKLRKKYAGSSSIYSEIRKLCLFGKKHEAKEVIFNSFYTDIFNRYGELTDYAFHNAKIATQERLDMIGEPMPEIIDKSKSWGDLLKFINAGYDINSKDIPVN